MQRVLSNYEKMNEMEFNYNSKRILIIDDEIYSCLAIRSLILTLRFSQMEKVEFCLSGKEALEKIKANIHTIEVGGSSNTNPSAPTKTEYDCDYGLIHSDCSMPMMDGYECSKRI